VFLACKTSQTQHHKGDEMVELGSEFIWLWFLEKKKTTHRRVHVKGL
jgi:hypothetical protein